jgi:hypothetical protein
MGNVARAALGYSAAAQLTPVSSWLGATPADRVEAGRRVPIRQPPRSAGEQPLTQRSRRILALGEATLLQCRNHMRYEFAEGPGVNRHPELDPFRHSELDPLARAFCCLSLDRRG